MIKLQNKDLKITYDFLMSIGVKGKKSTHRTRIAKAIEEQHKKYADEELNLLKDYCSVDDKGEFVRLPNGNLDISDTAKFNKEQESLANEYFVIDDTNLETALKTVKELVIDYNKELDGNDALAHFYLVEAFEEDGD
jgi:hypothetical protein